MPYTLEKEMIPDLTASLPLLFNYNQNYYAHACEVFDGTRVVDIVFADTQDPKELIPNWMCFEKEFNKLSISQLLALSIIRHEKKITAKKLGFRTWQSINQVKKNFLEPFLEHGLIRRCTRLSYEPTEWSVWSPSSVIAIEAKLFDWRTALKQAHDNKKRSDFSYVALPHDVVLKRESLVRDANKLGIGVIGVSSEEGSSVILQAEKTKSSLDSSKWFFFLKILNDLLSINSKWTFSKA
jgi:hypothetical protein